MAHTHFTYKELLNYGWGTTKTHFTFLLGIVLVSWIINILTGAIPIAGAIFGGLVTISVVSVLIMIVDGKVPTYQDLLKPFETYHTTLTYFLTLLLSIIVIVGGFILLILPGIYIAVRLMFTSFIAIEHPHVHPWDILKKSWNYTEGNFWKLFFWICTMIVVNLLGVLALGIGLLFTIPITGLAHTKLYRKLSTHHHSRHLESQTAHTS